MSQASMQGAIPITVTADAVVSAVPCRLIGAVLHHTATTTLVLYDNASAASGTAAINMRCAANDQAEVFFGDEGINCANGVYADWTAGVATVYIKK